MMINSKFPPTPRLWRAGKMQKSKSKFKIQKFIGNYRAGFTLIELLLVIAIIGVLATIFFANYLGVRQRARDSQRKSDLRQMQAALELYRYDQGNYPNNFYSLPSCSNASLTFGSTTYMAKVPCDPLTSPSYYNAGLYYYVSNGGADFTLCACLENTNDSQGATNSTCSTGVIPSCNSGKFFFLQSQ